MTDITVTVKLSADAKLLEALRGLAGHAVVNATTVEAAPTPAPAPKAAEPAPAPAAKAADPEPKANGAAKPTMDDVRAALRSFVDRNGGPANPAAADKARALLGQFDGAKSVSGIGEGRWGDFIAACAA